MEASTRGAATRWHLRGHARYAPLLLVTACSFFLPDDKTPSDRARAIEPKCRMVSNVGMAALDAPDAIDSVEPAYARVPGGPNGQETHLLGARLHVRPLPGLSRESATRTLECHEARVTLGMESPRVDDPYALAGHWLDFDVDSEADGFAVVVRTSDSVAARTVLARARAFESARARN